MKFNLFKTGLLTSAAAIGFASPALAQDTTSGPVAQSSTTAEAYDIENAIIVTARRVEEDLQDVPISITVFDQEQLTERNVAVASDLATYTPSLSVNQRYGPEKASFALRGFNQDQNTAPTVGVYFADVVGVRAQGGTTSGNTVGAGAFTDLENVQVLKGPQGTLFGRNTTGGAILLVPRRPSGDLEGYVEGTYGNYDQKRVQAALNLPLADTFKVRLAVDRNKRDGYMINRADLSDGSPPFFNDVDYFYGRFSMLAELTPTLENYTIFHYSKSDTFGYAARQTFCARDALQQEQANAAGGGTFNFRRVVFAQAACDQIDRQAARGDGIRDVEVRNPGGFLNIEQWQAINTTTWDATDSLTLKNIISYGEFRERTKFDLNSTNFFVPAIAGALNPLAAPNVGQPLDNIQLDVIPGLNNAAQSTFTEELQLQFESLDGRFNGVAGGYLEFSRPISLNGGRTSIFGYCNPPSELNCQAPLGFGIVSESRTKLSFDNHGIFAQGTYRVTDRLAFTGGIRYTFDKIDGLGQTIQYTYLNPLALAANFPPQLVPLLQTLDNPVLFSLTCNDSLRNPGVNIAPPVGLPGVGQINAGDGSLDPSKCNTNLTVESNEPTWLVNVDYKPNDDLLLYAKWARGYRQGGLIFTNPGLETFGPESLDSYEIGAKLSLRGSVSGYFNIAGFYNDFSDQQVILQSIAKPNSGLAGGNVIDNAGKVEIYGAEIDTSVLLFDSLRLSAAYTYLHSEVKEFTVRELAANSPFAQLVPTTSVGQPVTQAPKHTLTASATYTLPLDESIGDISFGATYTHRSEQFFDFNSPLGRVAPYDLLNLNFDWKRVAGSAFDLAAFMTNVTNEAYPVGVGLGNASFGFENVLYNQPRIYGVRLRFNFGQ